MTLPEVCWLFLMTGIFLIRLITRIFVLIPKCASPDNMTQFCLISLSNVIYKIISKVLANWLKMVLPKIISKNQCAFIPGCLITDNGLIAHETNHFLRCEKKDSTGYVSLKLDTSKAYDQVEWSFLREMMVSLGFNDRWISLIMKHFCSISHSLILNGAQLGYFSRTEVSAKAQRWYKPWQETDKACSKYGRKIVFTIIFVWKHQPIACKKQEPWYNERFVWKPWPVAHKEARISV